MNNKLYWVWLSLALGYQQHSVALIYNIYKDISIFYNGKEFEWGFCGLFSNAELNKLRKTSLADAQRVIDKCTQLGIEVISIEDSNYPQNLREIYAPPAVLYVKGNMPDFNSVLSLSVVGTRRATQYGIKVAFDFSYNISKYGVIIVSGGALGIDSSAHNGALRSSGTTVCVLGCGIEYDYLRQNKSMREAITVSGCVISEYPPDTPSYPYNFPARNRIISALSSGVLVVEAGELSGSLITANIAIEQGKDVFAVMGNVDSPMSRGSNKLIRDGAIPVCNYRDILEYYGFDKIPLNDDIADFGDDLADIQVKKADSKLPKNKQINKDEVNFEPVHRTDLELDEIENQIYMALNSDAIHIDDLAAKLGMPVFRILPIMTNLELMGIIENTGSRCYKIK